MSLKVKDIQKIMEDVAPLKFKESYDNVGLMIGDPEEDVKSILVALDCTLQVIEEAKEKGCNFILTHHPLLFKKPRSITTETLTGRKILELIKNNINVYSSHTNLDSVTGGINDMIMEILELDTSEIIEYSPLSTDNKKAGIGRIAVLKKTILLEEICEVLKERLQIDYLRYCGIDNMKINRVAVINGSGQEYIARAKKLGAQCIITGDTTYHFISDCNEENVAVIDAGHFETEWPAMIIIGKLLENKLKFMGFKNSVIMSKTSKTPYKYK